MKPTREWLDPARLCAATAEFKEFVEGRLLFQPRAVEALTDMYDASLSPLRDKTKPIASMMFLGPSGVGKTLAAELIAEYFFEDRRAFLKIDCAEYTEQHELSRLIGAPPSYLGYDESPLLATENLTRHARAYIFEKYNGKDPELVEIERQIQVLTASLKQAKQEENKENKKNTRKFLRDLQRDRENRITELMEKLQLPVIILLDEIEKAHPALYNFLLAIMDKGRITLANNENEIVDFSNAYIFMTSNAGAGAIANTMSGKGTIGIMRPEENVERADDVIYERAMEALRRHFSSAFMGRLDSVVVFRRLRKEHFFSIFDHELDERLTELTKKFPLMLTVTPEVRERIVRESTDHPEEGARLLKRKIEKHVLRPLGKLINSRQVWEGDEVTVSLGEEDMAFYCDVRNMTVSEKPTVKRRRKKRKKSAEDD